VGSFEGRIRRAAFEVLAAFHCHNGRFSGLEEEALFKKMAKLDEDLQAMMEANPDLEEIYTEEMGEAPGSVVYLPRAPTEEDWARAKELADKK